MTSKDSSMLCISHPNTDPWFNLAAEEYMLKNFSQNCFMLWRNEKAIIVGKHQNALAEINLDYVRENDIKVVRRLSGGGTVFHDLGNLNFTFIMNGGEGQLVNFRKYTQPILDVLHRLGVDASFGGRNDLVIQGRKFSGNAEHVFKKRVLHHGTLLFTSQIEDLENALRVNPVKYTDRGIKSVRSRVGNISEHLKESLSILEFRDAIMNYVVEKFPESIPYLYTNDDLAAISLLAEKKYASWEWNFGYSPLYILQKVIKTQAGLIDLRLQVEKGIIREANLRCDFVDRRKLSEIEDLLKGSPHLEAAILKTLQQVAISEYLRIPDPREFVRAMF
jgi:lipoate---protein ligase